ncbi:MAG TPA: DUF6701 domain-containing protein, partial [Rhodocyclaceae bacterium]|nr:DUF6701 domain-containing protein [Rhodocyclaceae bacterium]
ADGVSSMTGTEPSAVIRIGRLRLASVYGATPPPLKMPVEAQYWTGLSWIKNADDGCTPLANANFLMTPAGWTLSAPAKLAGGSGVISLTPTGPGQIVVCADLGPDNGVTCTATTSAALPWLQSKWPGGASYNNDPSAVATFGVFSPEGKRGVYNREMY